MTSALFVFILEKKEPHCGHLGLFSEQDGVGVSFLDFGEKEGHWCYFLAHSQRRMTSVLLFFIFGKRDAIGVTFGSFAEKDDLSVTFLCFLDFACFLLKVDFFYVDNLNQALHV